MITDILLITISLTWLIAASIIDIKTREVPDWLSYSLMIIALAIKGIHSIIFKDINFLLLGLLGLVIALALGSIMYYTKQWGGGDAKLLMGLSIIYIEYPKTILTYFNPDLSLPFLLSLIINIIILGTIYSLIWSIYLFLKNRKECLKNLKELTNTTKKIRNASLIISTLLIILLVKTQPILIPFAISPIIFYYFILYIKSVEKTSFKKIIPTEKLTEGDWITKDIIVNNHILYKKSSPGITKKQIEELKSSKIKEVPIKEGIPFIPTFLIAVVISLIYGNIISLII